MTLLLKGSASGRALLLGTGVARSVDTSTGVVEISTIEQSTLIAPTVVYADAVNIAGMAAQDGADPGEVYDPSFHEITFVWTLTRPVGASGTFGPTLNMPTAWNNRNLAYGKRVAFVLDEPGSYTLNLWCVDANGKTAAASTSFTVQDPDSVFTGTRTILYDPTGTGDPSNYPSADVQTTWTGVKSARTTLGATTARILVKRGEQVDGEEIANFGSSVSNIRIGPWGTGADPILGPRGVDAGYLITENGDGGNDELVIYGIKFQGGWDSATETGVPELPFRLVRNSTRTDPYFQLIHNCTFDGMVACWASAIGTGGNNFEARTCYSECTITNWRDYGLFIADGGDPAGDNRLAILGCSIQQDENALSGGSKNGLYNTHGCIRTTGMQNTYISGCSLFSRSGWSPLGSVTADNGALRLNTQANEGHNYVIDRVAIEGMVRVQDAEGNNDKAGNYLFDKVIQTLGSRNYDPVFSVAFGGTTIRNYLGVMLNKPAAHGAVMGEFISAENDGLDATNVASPVRVYNSTFLDLRNDANSDSKVPDAVAFSNFSAGTEANNVIHAPNRTSTVVADAPIDLTTSAGPVPEHKGQRYNFLHEEGTLASDVADGATLSIPYSQIKDTLYNPTDTDDGTATDQAYWTAISGTDTLHVIRVNDTGYHAQQGDISVSFADATNVVITNTSGVTWSSGAGWVLRLDRTTNLPAFESAQSSVGETVPTGRPQSGSAAIGDGDTGLKAYDDLLLAERPSSGNDRGALLAS